jgi:hypothetical protein
MTNYSTDADLEAYEPTVLTHLPDTTPTTTNFDAQHAEAKRVIDEVIVRHLPDELRDAVRAGESALGDLVDEEDLKTVSVFYTLFMIFNWISSRRGDIYWHKGRTYRALFQESLSTLSVDVSTDAVASTFEGEIRLGDVTVERE